jgi:hypothetical protein
MLREFEQMFDTLEAVLAARPSGRIAPAGADLDPRLRRRDRWSAGRRSEW